MKDDNILLEALKGIGYKYGYGNVKLLEIINNAIAKYNQSPSDESNQDELWDEVISEVEHREFMHQKYYEVRTQLKSQYKITRK